LSAPVSNPLLDAFDARDLDRLLRTLADDVIFYSPIISVPFRGKEEVGDLYAVLFETLGETTYTAGAAYPEGAMVSWRSEIRGTELEGTTRLRSNDQGLIEEITVTLRPFSGIAAFLRETGPPLARRRAGRANAVAVRALNPSVTGPLRLAGALAPRLLRLRR
jgi:hypothetical protein